MLEQNNQLLKASKKKIKVARQSIGIETPSSGLCMNNMEGMN